MHGRNARRGELKEGGHICRAVRCGESRGRAQWPAAAQCCGGHLGGEYRRGPCHVGGAKPPCKRPLCLPPSAKQQLMDVVLPLPALSIFSFSFQPASAEAVILRRPGPPRTLRLARREDGVDLVDEDDAAVKAAGDREEGAHLPSYNGASIQWGGSRGAVAVGQGEWSRRGQGSQDF